MAPKQIVKLAPATLRLFSHNSNYFVHCLLTILITLCYCRDSWDCCNGTSSSIILGYNSSIWLHVQILRCFVDSLHRQLVRMDVDKWSISFPLRINKSDIAWSNKRWLYGAPQCYFAWFVNQWTVILYGTCGPVTCYFAWIMWIQLTVIWTQVMLVNCHYPLVLLWELTNLTLLDLIKVIIAVHLSVILLGLWTNDLLFCVAHVDQWPVILIE